MDDRMLFTSESVTEGHPDKVADQISDAVLDAVLEKDPNGRVACETAVTTDFVLVMGEITCEEKIDYEKIARDVITDIGYTHPDIGFDAKSCEVLIKVHKQSPDISQGVTESEEREQGAGDQGMMFGYACDETPELMPAAIYYAHRLTERLAKVRKDKTLPWLRPDGKSQVTMEYENGKPVRVNTVVISTQHTEDVCDDKKDLSDDAKQEVIENVIHPVIDKKLRHDQMKIHINPTGRFVIGGPHGDAGLTGRKIIVDTYGGMGRHGGGAFSGKDPSKVDRSATYAARWIAKNIVAAGLAGKCEVQVAYAIGVAEPVSINVRTFSTGTTSDSELVRLVETNFDLRPRAILHDLNLLRPIYRPTAAYGHFGRTGDSFTWEKTDKADSLKKG